MAELNNTTTPEPIDELKRLEQLEAEQAKELEALEKSQGSGDTTPDGDRAPTGDKESSSASKSDDKTDTLSETEKQEVETAKAAAEKEGKELDVDEAGKPKRDAQGKFVKRDKVNAPEPIKLTTEERSKFDKYLAEKQGSKYAKDFSRRLVTWTELNAEKEKLATNTLEQQTKLQNAIAKFNADVEAFQAEKAQSTPTPEKYVAFAEKCSANSTLKEAEAIKAENEGRIEDAEKLRDEAKFLKRDAASATASAEHLRQNPPPSQKQQQEKFVAEQKTWIGKAVTDFPEFGKKDSDIQKQTADTFKAITSAHPEAARLPWLVYYCARIANAETVSNRVPAMDKELGELRTKVKELEALTNPTPSGGVARSGSLGSKNFEDMSEEEQYAMLRDEAAGIRR